MDRILLRLTDIFAKAPDYVLNFKKRALLGLTVIFLFILYGIFTLTSFDMFTDSLLQASKFTASINAVDESTLN